MNWLNTIEKELLRLRPNEHPGRTRTTARRIAGIALQHYYASATSDFLKLLQSTVADDAVPVDIRAAADRLAARLDANFSSPSIDPVGDAMAIVEFVKQRTS
jgi:uncharacterized protein (UPF0147 family)